MAGDFPNLRDIYKKNLLDYNHQFNKKRPHLWLWLMPGIILMGVGIWRLIYVQFNDGMAIIMVSFGSIMVFGLPIMVLFLSSLDSSSVNHLEHFICPDCLKTVVVNQLKFNCPFCNEQYGLSNDSFANMVVNERVLFDKCDNCNAKIRYMECSNCGKPIDLFAPYNQKELEFKRYG